jgi:hypothetical protein
MGSPPCNRHLYERPTRAKGRTTNKDGIMRRVRSPTGISIAFGCTRHAGQPIYSVSVGFLTLSRCRRTEMSVAGSTGFTR